MNHGTRDFDGKVAVVTGGSRGIGAATARLLAERGAAVLVSGRDEAAIAATVASIVDSGGAAAGLAADATDAAALDRLREHAEAEFGPVDVLMAFAGGNPARPQPVLEMTEAHWREVLDANLTATFLTLKAFVPSMLARGTGAVVTMSSTAGRVAGIQSPGAYSVAKAGVVMLTSKVAVDVGPGGVRVNCVSPSAIRTEGNAERIPPDVQRQIAESHPLRRMGEMADVAEAAAFLASDAASWLTGLTIDVAGGRITA